ncbi:MAG: site-2 protease family protein [Acidobacteria bacterium]|nr:site-2 protease family protein [Acidobacteriota bacterium]MBI3658462.1 site-2 protease family protein [Acidobacteriota bacterium]
MALIQYAVLLFSLSVHESAHAWTADYFGDYTARYLGRVSLNPIVHMDVFGTFLFPLINIFNPGIPVIGWAKPVPVNPARLRQPRRDSILVAAAGPASNLLIGLAFLLILLAIRSYYPNIIWEIYGFRAGEPGNQMDIAAPLIMILHQGFLINLLLAFFNFIPIPPLDGSKVLYGLLPARAGEVYERFSQYGFIILMALMITGQLNFIAVPIRYLRSFVRL